jgi:cell division protein FtsB
MWRKHTGIVFLAISLVVMQGVFWMGQNGVVDYIGLQQDLQDSRDRNARLSSRNDRLIEDVADLKSKTDAVEEIARNRLGMIRKDEVFYRIIEQP